MSAPDDPEHPHLATAELQARVWAAWQDYPAIARSTRLLLTRVGYGPADIPHLADEDLLAVPRIGPEQVAELRRHFPRVGS